MRKKRRDENVPRQGPGAEPVCLRLASCVRVLYIMQERFHSISPGDFESMFIKAGDREVRKGLR